MQRAIDQGPIDWSRARVLLTGGGGFLGSWVARVLASRGVSSERVVMPRRTGHDLRDPRACARVVGELLIACAKERRTPVVLHCAGLSGGLALNRDRPLDLYHDNLSMGSNMLMALARAGADRASRAIAPRIVLVGHMTSYPADAPQPLREEALMAGPLDPVTSRLGRAKGELLPLATLLHQQFALASIMVVPTNLYGEGDAIDNPARSHAAGAMMHRFVLAVRDQAPSITHWGTGKAIRDFLHVGDAARGVVKAADHAGETGGPPQAINLGSGTETTLSELSDLIARAAGYTGRIAWDATKPDGVPRRVLSIDRARTVLGWSPQVPLEQGIARTIAWAKTNL